MVVEVAGAGAVGLGEAVQQSEGAVVPPEVVQQTVTFPVQQAPILTRAHLPRLRLRPLLILQIRQPLLTLQSLLLQKGALGPSSRMGPHRLLRLRRTWRLLL